MSQCQEIVIFHNILFACHTIVTFDHTEGLLITDNDNIGIMLFNEADRTGMVGLHVVNDEILDRTFANNTFYFTKIYFEITSIYRINQSHCFVVYQVRVIRHSIR